MATLAMAPAHGAGNGPEPGLEEWLRVGSVALAVRDLDRVAVFYRDVIGLHELGRDRDGGAVRFGTTVGNAILELLHRPDALPDDPAEAGLFHTAFLLPSRADLGRWLSHLGELGQPLDGAADHLVSEAAYLSDPEGNGIEVYADRPRAEWRWTAGPDGRWVAMANRPLDAESLLREAKGARWVGTPGGTRIGHIHLRVGDVAEARRFYGEALDLDLTAARPEAAFFSTGGYHHHLAANAWHSAGAGRRDPRRAGLASVTLEASAGHVPASIARHLREAGQAAGYSVRDPWGTTLRFRAAPAQFVLPA